MNKYTVLRDTREKVGKGWRFQKSEYCEGTIIQKLDEGDYSLKGFEKILIVERKGSISEFAANLIQPRFFRELDRLAAYPHSFLILEFLLDDLVRYPYSLNLSPKRIKRFKITGSFLIRKTIQISLQYPTIQTIFAGQHGLRIAANIFKQMVE